MQRSWQRCALALHVHRQTVIYRMRRVEQLTGRSLSETGDIATLWLALSALEILRQGIRHRRLGWSVESPTTSGRAIMRVAACERYSPT